MVRIIDVKPSKEHRLKQIAIAPERLLDWLMSMRTPRTFSTTDIPEDAAFVAAEYDPYLRLFRITVESQSFPQVHEGCPLEMMAVCIGQHYETVSVHR
jgi:hypothetical protein